MSVLPSVDTYGPEHDVVSHTVHFCRSLREYGLLVGPSETSDAILSLGLVDPLDRNQVYWAFRAILVSRVSEIPSFDECFRQFWTFRLPRQEGPPLVPGPTQAGGARRFNRQVLLPASQEEVDEAQPPVLQVIRTGASAVALNTRRDLTVFQGAQLAEMSQIAARLVRALPARPGRRRRRHKRKGVPDLRSAFRLSLPQGGDIILLPRRRKVPRVPRFLVLLDVSGSMDRHARLLLQLVYALGQRSGRVETFVFSTSLTRVTQQLKVPSFSEALWRIGNLVSHWSGGTRIGECLADLNNEYADIPDRNTTVFLLSDGWETGDPDNLARQLAVLKRRVRQLVWLNPLLGTPDYQPLTVGLQAARPHVDLFASALDLESLRRLPGLLRG